MKANRRTGFARRLIAWQKRCGRRNLPWQGERDPYRIWVSEVMLQQTQVATVIPYYLRFLERFPDVRTLARSNLDGVLAAWSGLGYYSRARSLHRAAVELVSQHGGRFPSARQALQELPGIGRSSAAAIAVFAFGAREAILDANAKRVLARCYAVAGRTGELAVESKLWTLAESLLPDKAIECYTQALMDLGSAVCVRSRPACERCPLALVCKARRLEQVDEFPARRARRTRPRRTTVMAIVMCARKVLLVKRPPTGIWGAMWSLPEFASAREALAQCRKRYGCDIASQRALEPLVHGFTHFELTILPLLCRARGRAPRSELPEVRWLDRDATIAAPLPAPVRKLLTMLRDTRERT